MQSKFGTSRVTNEFPRGQVVRAFRPRRPASLRPGTTAHPEWVLDLIHISSRPDGGTVPRKAAWVLRHAALLDAKCIEGQARSILDAVDASSDASVHRELLKALLEAPQQELHAMGEELYDLG